MTSDTSWFYAMKCTDVDALACTGRSVSEIPPSHMVCMGRAHKRVGRASVFRERWWEDWDNSAEPKCGSALGAGLPAGLMGVGSGKRDAIRGPGRATRMRVSLVQQTRFSVSRCLSSSLQSCASLPTHVRTHIRVCIASSHRRPQSTTHLYRGRWAAHPADWALLQSGDVPPLPLVQAQPPATSTHTLPTPYSTAPTFSHPSRRAALISFACWPEPPPPKSIRRPTSPHRAPRLSHSPPPTHHHHLTSTSLASTGHVALRWRLPLVRRRPGVR